MQSVLDAARSGSNASTIARATGVPRSTVQGWLADAARLERRRHRASQVRPNLPPAPYAYLLGMYLGDGWLVEMPRGSYRLSIALDARYPGIIAATAEAIAKVNPGHAVNTQPRPPDAVFNVSSYWRLWPVVLPQHGAGRKHQRAIQLETWQSNITEAHCVDFLRGLMHSDGCRFVAKVRKGGRTYSYVRYHFTNRSDDIKEIVCRHLDLVGIRWTRPNEKDVAIATRSDVAKLDRFVGPKR